MKETSKITINRKAWFLFSVDNNYDQPPNNMVCWWSEKPKLEEVAKAVDLDFPNGGDEAVLSVVNLWSGKEVRILNTDYRLEEVMEATRAMSDGERQGRF